MDCGWKVVAARTCNGVSHDIGLVCIGIMRAVLWLHCFLRHFCLLMTKLPVTVYM